MLGVHDWGGLIGLRWACDHPDAVTGARDHRHRLLPRRALARHGQVAAHRGRGRAAAREHEPRPVRDGACGRSAPASPTTRWTSSGRPTATRTASRSQLDLYRSGDFAKLEPYDGKLAALGVPAAIVWGAKDEFAPVGGAHRFQQAASRTRELVVLDDAGHFVMEDEPDRVAAEIRAFLESYRHKSRRRSRPS